MQASAQNKPVNSVDFKRFEGKWYSLASIPTLLDKNWRETIENYSIDEEGYYNVNTTYRKVGDDEIHSIGSKLFQVEGSQHAEMKAQFLWPFKIDYWVIELADDYSYTVIGHPKEKYLFIMSRTPNMDKTLYDEIVERCKAKGYDTSKLVSQEHGNI